MPNSADWLVFLGAAAVFAITPGPGVMYVLARSLKGGRSEGVRSVLGNAMGASIHVVAAAFGLSALLATSTVAFMIVKYAGVGYLVYLGVQAIRHRHDPSDHNSGPPAARRWARSPVIQGTIAELLNPKTALFFMAFLPHFVQSGGAPVFIALGMIALAMTVLVDLLVAVFAGTFGAALQRKPKLRARQQVVSGLTMIGLGGFVAAAE